jgi:uncharacterized protein
MRIDVHVHIFPPEIVRNRERFFAGEPEFELLYGSPKARLVGAEAVLEMLDRDAIDRAVVFGFPWKNAETAARHNDYVLNAAAKYAPQLIPLACMDPLGETALREAQRCLQAGARGLGELAIYGPCAGEAARQSLQGLIDCCRARNAVLLVHANEPVGHYYPGKAPQGLDFYYELARMAAGVTLIFAHWGGGLCFYELLKKEAPEVLARVYYDTAASPYLYKPSIYGEMVRILGKGKILFGSDYPLLLPQRYFQDMAASRLSEEETRAILGENAARLFP